MKKRPTLKTGDVCRLHKKARRARKYLRNATLVVESVEGDGAEGGTIIRGVATHYNPDNMTVSGKFRLARRQLWFTGYNNIDKINKLSALLAIAKRHGYPAPRGQSSAHIVVPDSTIGRTMEVLAGIAALHDKMEDEETGVVIKRFVSGRAGTIEAPKQHNPDDVEALNTWMEDDDV